MVLEAEEAKIKVPRDSLSGEGQFYFIHGILLLGSHLDTEYHFLGVTRSKPFFAEQSKRKTLKH